MCQIDITREQETHKMVQGVAHNLHTSVGDMDMLVEVCAARGDMETAFIVQQASAHVQSVIDAVLSLFGQYCRPEHTHTADEEPTVEVATV